MELEKQIARDSREQVLELRQCAWGAHAAFTLIELLVVVGLIGILAATLGTALRSGDGTVSARSGERIAAGMMQAARAQAVLKGTRARCMINNDRNSTEKYLRYLGVVFRDPKSDRWLAANRGAFLPKGVYFNIGASDLGGPTPVMNDGRCSIEFPRAGGEEMHEDGGEWVYYEFDSTGRSMNPGNRFVIGTARLDDSGLAPVFDQDSRPGGFIVQRSGVVMIASDPDDLL